MEEIKIILISLTMTDMKSPPFWMWKWWMKNYGQINEGHLGKINPELYFCNSRIFKFCSLTHISFRIKKKSDRHLSWHHWDHILRTMVELKRRLDHSLANTTSVVTGVVSERKAQCQKPKWLWVSGCEGKLVFHLCDEKIKPDSERSIISIGEQIKTPHIL